MLLKKFDGTKESVEIVLLSRPYQPPVPHAPFRSFFLPLKSYKTQFRPPIGFLF